MKYKLYADKVYHIHLRVLGDNDELIRLLFAEMKIPEDRIEKYLAKAGKCILTKSGSRKEIGRLVQVCKDLEYGPITEELFRKNALYQTEISMRCCDVILWWTDDKRVVSAIDSTRDNIGLVSPQSILDVGADFFGMRYWV